MKPLHIKKCGLLDRVVALETRNENRIVSSGVTIHSCWNKAKKAGFKAESIIYSWIDGRRGEHIFVE